MSQVLTNSANGQLARSGKYFVETLPQPMTPTRTFFETLATAGVSAACRPCRDLTFDKVSAAPAAAVRSKNFRRSNSVVIRCSANHESAQMITISGNVRRHVLDISQVRVLFQTNP